MTKDTILEVLHKQDDPSEYSKIITARVKDDLEKCNGTDNAVAKIMYNLLKGRFVCGSCDSNSWYYYDGHFWREDCEALELRKQFSTTVLNHYDTLSTLVKQDASIDDLDSNAGSNCTVQKKLFGITKIKQKLQTHNFKKAVIKECTEYFYDSQFLKKLDANPNLVGFNNGVYHLRERKFVPSNPSDFVSLSTGYDYISDENKNESFYNQVVHYFETLHPVETQRKYWLRTLARQLFGDTGKELFHIHFGNNGSAANGKTKSWEINKLCFGDYVQKFDVGMLVNQKRKDASAPSPEYRLWKGKRFLYCTEPNPSETLNGGVMKDLTGGEQVVYRLLFSNIFDQFIPQWKLHIMTNDLPSIDGTDEGVKRRIRVLPYISTFVDKHQVDEKNHLYQANTEITYGFRENDALKMEYMRYILDHYDHDWDFQMTDYIKESSRAYLSENDNIGNFVKEFLERDKDSFVTLKEIKELYKRSDHCDGKLGTLRTRLERVLGVSYREEMKLKGVKYRGVFEGYRVIQEQNVDDL